MGDGARQAHGASPGGRSAVARRRYWTWVVSQVCSGAKSRQWWSSVGTSSGSRARLEGSFACAVQRTVAQEPGACVIDVEAAGRSRVGLAADLVVGVVQTADDGDELSAGGVVGNGGSVAGESRRVEPVGTGADDDGGWGDAQEQAGQRCLALAFPEPEVEMVLVRGLVLAEAGVAVDAEDRSVDPGLGGDTRHELPQLGADGVDERLRRVEVGRLVSLPGSRRTRTSSCGARRRRGTRASRPGTEPRRHRVPPFTKASASARSRLQVRLRSGGSPPTPGTGAQPGRTSPPARRRRAGRRALRAA